MQLEKEVAELKDQLKRTTEALPKQLCNCAFYTWHRKLDFEALSLAAHRHDLKWVENAIPHVFIAITDLEDACKLDLSEARLALAEVSRFTKDKNLDMTVKAADKISPSITAKLLECSAQ